MIPRTKAHTFRLVYAALLDEGHRTLAAEFAAAAGLRLEEPDDAEFFSIPNEAAKRAQGSA
jgi:hypothetical protein